MHQFQTKKLIFSIFTNCFIFICTLFPSLAHGQSSRGGDSYPPDVPLLTIEEKTWLAAHKNIRLGVDPAWSPFEFFDTTKV